MKRKLLFLAEGILLLVLLLLCFFGSGNVIGADSGSLHREEETGYLVSDTFALKPGVYRIVVEADAAGGGIGAGMEIGLTAEQMPFRAIKGNRATICRCGTQGDYLLCDGTGILSLCINSSVFGGCRDIL